MNRLTAIVGAGLGLAVSGAASAAIIYPVNDGFETPDLGAGGGAYKYGNQAPISTTPAATLGWTFSGGSGIAANGSGFGVANATNLNNNPNGGNATSTSGQAAVLQGGDGTAGGTSISQSVTLPVGTTKLSVLFDDEGRKSASGYGGDNGIVVYVDGNLIPGGGTIAAPLFPVAGDNTFNPETTTFFPIGAGAHTITIAGDNTTLPPGTDATSFVDNVKLLVTTPEPGSVSLLGFGVLSLLARRRRA